jgi:hypothetical protein
MTRTLRLLAGLSLITLILSGVCWGQAGKGGGPSGLYDPKTVVTVSGIVVSMTPPAVKGGLPYLVYLTLKTETGKLTVFLGPNLSVDKLPMKIQALDRIAVTGSKVTWEGREVLLAAEVTKGDQGMKLRNADGVPVWSGRGGT